MRRIFFLPVMLWLMAYVTQAQTLLSAEDCRKMALEYSDDIKIAAYQHDKAVVDQKAVQTSFFPKISGSATYAYVFKDIDMGMNFDLSSMGVSATIPISMEMSLKGAYMAGISLQQPVFVGGKIISGNRMAKKGVEITEQNKRLTRMNTIVEVEKAYWMYVSIVEKVKLLSSYALLLDSLYQNVSNFYEQSMTTINDIQKVRTKRSNMQYEYQRAKSGLDLARMSLCHLIGIDMSTSIVAIDTAIVIQRYGMDSVVNMGDRPEYQMLLKQVELKELEIKNTRAGFLPTVGFSAGYTYIGGMKFAGNELDMRLPMIAANVSIPLFHFGEGAKKIKSARLAHDISVVELNKNKALMDIEIQQAYSAYQNTFLLIDAASESLEEARENLKLAQDNYEMRMGTVFDVLEAQVLWQEAYSNDIEARTNCKIAEIEYLKVIARLE
ncbi:MAG: TolC family protein [Prevotellaceae bacterium]|jgi:outer membrane protein TolC|nr:TolC family protein [Prevotellaceae bacterium]